MIKKVILLFAFCSIFVFANTEIDELKAMLAQQMKVTKALQKRVAQLEKKQLKRKRHTYKTVKKKQKKVIESRDTQEEIAQVSVESTQTPSATFSQKSYIPDIAFIMDGSSVGRNMDNSTYKTYYIPGFSTYDPNNELEIPFNKNRGFNFNYAEVSMSSTVGPYFDATAIFHLQPSTFEIEEAYITSRALPYNLRAKAGKFRSDFGRINSIHQHAWKFTSQPLVYEALFGSEGINDTGLQLQWVLPTDTYFMAGVEALQGVNDVSFGDTQENNLYIAYVKGSVDITDLTSVLGGVSIAHGKNIMGENTDVYGVDLTVKTFFDSYSSLLWQSELLYRNMNTSTNKQKQAGFYTQFVYQYNQNWATGIRYEDLYKNIETQPDDLNRYTAMIEYKPFEFTKFRLQYTFDKSKVFGINNKRKNVSELLLGFTIEAGAHGAHAF